jgi:hypothetical protein
VASWQEDFTEDKIDWSIVRDWLACLFFCFGVWAIGLLAVLLALSVVTIPTPFR